MSYVDGSEYADGSTSYSTSDSPQIRSEHGYSDTASRLESAIAASAAPTDSYSSSGKTAYIGLSGSITTPVGGAAFDFGGYSDKYGMVGAYGDLGEAAGRSGLSLAIVVGETQSLAGRSINVSTSLGPPRLGISPNISVGVSIDPVTLQVIGKQLGFGLSLGPAIGAGVTFTDTTTIEFSSLYLTYIQFLNWARSSGEYGF
jgi:hypothetical protein